MLFGISASLACQCFGQRMVKMTELTLFSWLFRKLDWANEVLDLIYSNRDTNKSSFSAFNRNEWQIFPPLPTTLSYPRALKTDKEEVVPQGHTIFFSGFHGLWICRMLLRSQLLQACVGAKGWWLQKPPARWGAVHWLHRGFPPLCCPHPMFTKKGVPPSLLCK